ncbi:ammonium transporter [Jeotgalibacillus sp. S-D1]|uniref:ammonium transporter n=1 Tax=Jeotgalibacillus sp. S-D1 TaxID=2552189 RepID=UPI00105A144C|nr:ammonium transporter [Jeotgalibacillus sp. S-D1]TDL35345.1 ammonium transporter [Jeotgalibacillus sp. S-D1]
MKKKIGSIILASSLLSTSALAAPVTAESVQLSVDTMWVMIATILVFFMHAGFTMVEAGFTRAKNSLNIIMKNVLTISLGSILYFLIGYGLMFGNSNGFFGTSGFALSGVEDIGFFVFQAVFAATCATIISGAVAERMKLSSYLLLTMVMTGAIYPIVGHWIWGGGWISELGFVDFAGSTVVHLTGAVGAFVTVLFLGSRIGKYDGKGVNAIPGHNIPIGSLGVFILWFGWFGFNGGSSLAADPTLVPIVISTTLLSASGGVISSALYSRIRFKKIDPSITLNGALGGLVGITAGTANVSFIGAIVIGLIAGVILVEGIRVIDAVLRVDDPVGAIAVHGICGIWGTLAVGLFDTANGAVYGGGLGLLGVQAIGIGAVIIWTAVTAGASVFILKAAGGIRVSREEELVGLDYAEHGSNAYEFKESLASSSSSQTKNAPGDLVERLNQLGSTIEKPKQRKTV